jgi:hypothetical protein
LEAGEFLVQLHISCTRWCNGECRNVKCSKGEVKMRVTSADNLRWRDGRAQKWRLWTSFTTIAGRILDHVPELLRYDIKFVLPTSDAAHLRSKLAADASCDHVTIESSSIEDAKWVQSISTKHAWKVAFLHLTGTVELFTTLNFLDAM